MAKTIFRPEYRQVVDRLRAARDALGMTQVELAERLGRNQQWVSLMESGSRRLDVIEFAEVCVALQADPAAVLAIAVSQLGAASPVQSTRRRDDPSGQ